MKKIIVIGASGTIGSAIVRALSHHQVIKVGHASGDIQCDIHSADAIRKMFEKTGKVDAVVIATGNVHFEELSKMSHEKYMIGLNSKLMGQVNTVLIGTPFLNDSGSFTLTSGTLSHDPIRTGSSASMVNRAVEGFVIGAAIELPRGIRINTVSPTVIAESMTKYASFFPGFEPVTADRAAQAYVKSVEGLQTGQIYNV